MNDRMMQPLARVLVDLPPPHLAFLLDLLELGNDNCQKLQIMDELT